METGLSQTRRFFSSAIIPREQPWHWLFFKKNCQKNFVKVELICSRKILFGWWALWLAMATDFMSSPAVISALVLSCLVGSDVWCAALVLFSFRPVYPCISHFRKKRKKIPSADPHRHPSNILGEPLWNGSIMSRHSHKIWDSGNAQTTTMNVSQFPFIHLNHVTWSSTSLAEAFLAPALKSSEGKSRQVACDIYKWSKAGFLIRQDRHFLRRLWSERFTPLIHLIHR